MIFADDTYLISASEKRDTIHAEPQNIDTWATRNNLRLNKSKSRKMVVLNLETICKLWTISIRFWHPATDLSMPFNCLGPKGLPVPSSTMSQWQLPWWHGAYAVRCSSLVRTRLGKSRLQQRFKDKATRMGYLQANYTSVAGYVAAAEQSLFR